MSTLKTFEIRDRATCFYVVCVNLNAAHAEQESGVIVGSHFWKFGYGAHNEILMANPGSTLRAKVDPYDWNDRTYFNAHCFIRDNWLDLKSGMVIDVEWLLGERKEPKTSEAFSNAPEVGQLPPELLAQQGEEMRKRLGQIIRKERDDE